jgi:hypothetical protein
MKMYRARFVLLPILASAACVGASKSSNPLSPVVAGPIAGVGISAPVVIAPAVDAQIDTGTQPITLQVQNATTNGVRPLSYTFEIATDTNFTNKVFTRGSVAQDPNGRTSVRLSDPLGPERKYYWHAQAADGANTGPFSATSAFSIFTPVIIGAPTLIQPISDVTTSTQQPQFVIGNASRTGPAGAIAYSIEVADSNVFTHLIATWVVPEASNQTTSVAPTLLTAGQYFWHARASDASHTGPFSAIQSFHTPASGGGHIPVNGDWQSCSSQVSSGSNQSAIVSCVHDLINPTDAPSDLEVVKRVAWLLRAQGGGMLIKNGGDNIVTWHGYSFSASRLCLPSAGPSAYLWKIISDAGPGGANGATWQDNGPVAATGSSCVPAIDPSLP